MELQNMQAAFLPVNAQPSPIQGVSQNQTVEPYILAALNTEDRVYVLELGNIFEALIVDQRAFISFSPPSSPTHSRQLAIFCAIYYNLMPDYDFLTGGLLVFRTASSRIPPRRLLDLANPERMDRAGIEHPLQPNTQSRDNLEVPSDSKPSLLTPPQTPLPATYRLPPSPINPPSKANSTVITDPSVTLESEAASAVPSTIGGIEIRTCSRPLNPNALPFVPTHLRIRAVAPQQLYRGGSGIQTSSSTNGARIDAKSSSNWRSSPPVGHGGSGIQISSSTRRTRIDAKSLPNWRSLSTAGHGGLDTSLRSRRKLIAGSPSTASAASSGIFMDWRSVSAYTTSSSGANSP